MDAFTLIVILILVALVFDFLNGLHDSATVVATMIASRAMSGRAALTLAAVANFVGAFLFGVTVAKTIGSEVALPESTTIAAVLSGLVSASIWNPAIWYYGIPASSSHALIGGIIGAVAIGSGVSALGLVVLGFQSKFCRSVLGYFSECRAANVLGMVVMKLS